MYVVIATKTNAEARVVIANALAKSRYLLLASLISRYDQLNILESHQYMAGPTSILFPLFVIANNIYNAASKWLCVVE